MMCQIHALWHKITYFTGWDSKPKMTDWLNVPTLNEVIFAKAWLDHNHMIFHLISAVWISQQPPKVRCLYVWKAHQAQMQNGLLSISRRYDHQIMSCIMDAPHNDIHNEDWVRVLCEGQIMMEMTLEFQWGHHGNNYVPATAWTVNGFGRTLPKSGLTNLYATNWMPTAEEGKYNEQR